MPLSEHEQRLLEEMERSLYQNDADFVAKVGGKTGRPGYRSIVLGILLAVVGIGVLLAGVFVQIPLVGILGFVVMLGGVLLAITPRRRGLGAAPSEPGQKKRSHATQPGFMDRLGERWDKRQDGER
jgi:hypothetical protein